MERVPSSWDAVIVNFNSAVFLDSCLRALARSDSPPNRTIVVDNASDDDSLLELSAWPSVEVIGSTENLGYAGGANLGVAESDAGIVVILNPDVEIDAAFGTALLERFAEQPELGVAGAKLLFPESNRIQHAGGIVNFPELTTAHRGHGQVDQGQFNFAEDVDYATGAVLAIRRNAFEEVGGFDSEFHPAYWEDVDICWRIRLAGWRVKYEPSLRAVHFEAGGAERGDAYYRCFFRNRLRFAAKHLTSSEWWQLFLPAEINRLRGDISAVESVDWPIRSGAGDAEIAARSGLAGTVIDPTLVDGSQLWSAIEQVRPLASLADPAPGRSDDPSGRGQLLKRLLRRFSGRAYAEELYWHQRQFNEQVVRAFEAQDRLNREVVAQLLLAMLIDTRPSRGVDP